MADVISRTDTSSKCCSCLLSNVCASVKSPIRPVARRVFISLYTYFRIKAFLLIINAKCIMSQAANKPITSFNWY